MMQATCTFVYNMLNNIGYAHQGTQFITTHASTYMNFLFVFRFSSSKLGHFLVIWICDTCMYMILIESKSCMQFGQHLGSILIQLNKRNVLIIIMCTIQMWACTYFSIPTKVYTAPAFVSTSKSNDLVLPALLAKFTFETSSKRMWTGGLCTKMKPLSSGYRKPVAALKEQAIDCAPEFLKIKYIQPVNYKGNTMCTMYQCPHVKCTWYAETLVS